jgi:transcriptional regulator with XRE-family HTH domain
MKKGTKSHHHGVTIKEGREACGMTQEQLASVWHGPNQGVSVRYIQSVEAGNAKITNPKQLRYLSTLLSIPLWKFGLSEYDPFGQCFQSQKGRTMLDVSLDTAETLIRQSWYFRRAVALPQTEKAVQALNQQFDYFLQNYPPPVTQEKRFLRFYAQVQRLNGVLHIEHKQYAAALCTFEEMYKTATELKEPATTASALVGIGTELERAGKKKDAIQALEQARDEALRSSRQMIVFTHAYLARAYASTGEASGFERAINIARQIAEDLQQQYGDGTDFVFHAMSGILAELSYGYLDIGEPQKTIALKDEIANQIAKEGNIYLKAWIPLDYARAYQMLHEIEKSVEEARTFFYRSLEFQSPHALSRALRHLRELEEAGFADVQAVKDFREELTEAMKYLQNELRLAVIEEHKV